MAERGVVFTRVAVLDGDVLAQYALESLFAQSTCIRLVKQLKSADNIDEALTGDIDLLLVALETIVSRGLDLADFLGGLAGKITVLVTSTRIEPELVVACLRAGAAGFVWKGVDAELIQQAVISAMAGDHPILPPIAGDLLFHVLNGSTRKNKGCLGLTNREQEVLGLVAKGMSNKEIAVALDLSVRTVKAHVSSVLQKLGVADRTQAAVMAIKIGVDGKDGIGMGRAMPPMLNSYGQAAARA